MKTLNTQETGERTQHASDFNYRENAAVCDEAREVAASFSRMLGWNPVDAYNAVLQGVAIAEKRPINKAAPELLSTLRSLTASLEIRLTAKNRDVEAWDILNAARAAIAKAEGE